MDTIVDNTRPDLSTWFTNKPLTKKQATYIKYENIIIDDKITCEKCNISVCVMSYDNHLKSNTHKVGKSAFDTFKCECGEVLSNRYKEAHNTSQTHINKINHKRYKNVKKFECYDYSKDKVNCCSRCLKISVPDCYFLNDTKLCICCDEILKGGEKRCRNCKENKDINDFERPYLIRCRKCANTRLSNYVRNKKLKDLELEQHWSEYDSDSDLEDI